MFLLSACLRSLYSLILHGRLLFFCLVLSLYFWLVSDKYNIEWTSVVFEKINFGPAVFVAVFIWYFSAISAWSIREGSLVNLLFSGLVKLFNNVLPLIILRTIYGLFCQIPHSVTVKMFLCEVKITPLCNTEDILDKVKNFSENLGIFFTDDKLSEVVKSINFDGEAIKQLLQTEAERVWGDPDFVKFVLILGPGTVKVFGVWFFFLVLTRVILFLLTKLIERLDISLSNHVHEENLYSVEHPAHIFCDIGMFFGETLVLLTQPSVE